ncbi:Crp/Fnr family transcriptional regulator [Lacibacter sp. H407]|uniref:Crp/Fnr family transcriptional regulator n=1 Tax=Lacibacter sp. H407 TaxID=3133423 RepID=UPI0030C22F90
MYEQVTSQLIKLINLDKSETSHFISKLQIKQFQKKEIVLKEGAICKFSFFINKGCFRYFYNINGTENTGQFFFENSWYTDYDSYLSGKPSKQTIETLEKSEIILLAKSDLQQLFHDIPKFEKFGRIMAENAFLGLRNRNEMLTNQTAEERYLNLIKERPKVFERVPQHYIASYLGIKPPSLSRIRKRIVEAK